jgi:hypothetical protein
MANDLQSTFFNGNDFARSATYTPITGAAYSLAVIFDAAYQEVEVGASIPVMSTQPQAQVIETDLQAEPANGEKLTVDGIVYLVREYQPDGTGVGVLKLTKE